MRKRRLIILTHHFPVTPGEGFLTDEINIIAPYFDQVLICPGDEKGEFGAIPPLQSNVSVVDISNLKPEISKPRLLTIFLPIILNEFKNIPSKGLFFSLLKFNFSLLKQCYIKAFNIVNLISDEDHNIIYSYWCDDLAITGAFCKQFRPEISFVSRAHGFDVFEEQSDFRHIFFRRFQLSKLDRLWTVSKAGELHLKKRNPAFKDKIASEYLGIQSDGKVCFEKTKLIRIVTCSHVRSIKRLDLLVRALKNIKDRELEWHIIGNGPDLENLKNLSIQLQSNCRLIFHGHLSIEKIHQLYGAYHFDFLVSLSSSEGLPVSMMEAISHGIPLLSTDVGGCSEIVNENTGILIPADFSDQKLIKIIENCKSGKFNELDTRQEIVSFWKANFFSETNYKLFAGELLKINSN